MSKYRKFATGFILAEILLLIAVNIWGLKTIAKGDNQYKVDILRISQRIEAGEAASKIDLGEYDSILAVEPFVADGIYNNRFEVRSAGGILYCFEYRENDYTNIITLNALVVLIILANVFLLIYIDKKMITPFNKMDHLTQELAKGNLAVPIKQEKSKFFGRFLWGMDMLRETLEDDKRRELELLKEKKTLVLSLSHDIKTPLSAIDLYAKALKRNLYETEEERDAAFAGIDNNIAEIKKYVKEIMDASREDFITLEVNNREIYLSEAINKTKAYYADRMKTQHVTFNVDDFDNCLLHGDEDRIIEVLQNTIENALKYGDGKEISISFDEEENCKLVTVANSGCELKEEELLHIFDSFYRGSNCKNAAGNGLGLYICKELMHKMDGDIFAKANNGYFLVTLVLRKA